ncbi:hypothetical protein FCM35_KLT00417 [Carex littledalei]|uniref:CCHC-type domain-containing protein n=1 Tax=Carex littledalei TaxID=544730 RepID=A0A833S1L7_9POAL|nr:hypothetical protein FCM35_KLT00417 [Carex littledalei]
MTLPSEATQLATRLAKIKLLQTITAAAITRRKTEIATFRRDSYAQVLTTAIKREQVRQQKQVQHQPLRQPVHLHHAGSSSKQQNVSTRLTNPDNGDEGWTVVKRKKPIRQAKPQAPQTLLKCKQELLAQGRCFKCLERGHRRFQCQRQIKCLKCGQTGHTAGRCPPHRERRVPSDQPMNGQRQNEGNGRVNEAHPTGLPYTEVNAEPTPTPPLILQRPIYPQLTLVKATPILTSQQQTQDPQPIQNQLIQAPMDAMANWETMPLTDPAYMQDGRAEDMRVFLPRRTELTPATEWIDRSAIILTGPNHNDDQLVRRIVHKLATFFSRHPRQFEVRPIPPAQGDLVAIFPDRDMMKRAVQVGALTLSPGVQVQIMEYSRHAGMTYDPTTHKARILIHDLPHCFWTWEHIAQMVSGFGALEKMAPVFVNGNYSELRVLVGCYHPTKIPPYVTVTQDPFTITCGIELEGWLHNEVIQVEAPYTGGERSDENNLGGGEGEATYWENEWRRTVRGARNHSFDSRQSSGPVTRFNRSNTTNGTEEILEGTVNIQNGEHRLPGIFKTAEGTVTLVQTSCYRYLMQATSINGLQSTELYVNTITTLPAQFSTKDLADLGLFEGVRAPTQQIQQQAVVQGLQITGLAEMGFGLLQTPSGPTTPSLTMAHPTGPAAQGLFEAMQQSSEGPTIWHGGPSPNQKEQLILTGTAQTDLIDGPPPGFPGPPKFVVSARRSPRLSEKNRGPYISPEERARLVSKPGTLEPPKGKPKRRFANCQPKLQYFESHGPLSHEQAELILLAAGIDPQGKVEDQLSTFLGA